MAIGIALPVRGYFRGVTLPLGFAVSEDVGVDVRGIVDELRGLIGGDVFERLDRVFEEALRDEVYAVLNTDDLVRDFPVLAERFWARMLLPLVEFSDGVYASLTSGALTPAEFRGVMERLAVALARGLRHSGYRYADDLIYAMAILVERDLWIADKVSKLGLEELVEKLTSRALDTILQFAGYSMYLVFAWTSATVAVLNLVKGYNEVNRDTLASWSREYAREVDGYLETLDLLLDDETYSDLLELGIIKR